MVTPQKGQYDALTLNAEGRRVGDTWDPDRDEKAGEQCKAYGAANIMRLPGRLHITWENDNTLVIDTTGVDERPWLDEEGHPRSSSAHIQERYTRPDEYNLQLTVTVDDPKFYTKPWTWMRANFYWMKAQEFAETFCIPSEALQYRDTLAKPSGIEIR